MRLGWLWIGLLFMGTGALLGFTLEGPKGWEKMCDAEQLPTKVKLLYIGPGKGQFAPSINLAMEENKLSLEQYVLEAKSYHEKTADTTVTRLGKMMTQGGEAELLQIDRPSGWGEVRFIQAALKIDNTAYVITATCLQEEFGSLSRAIFQTIKSFRPDEKR